MHFSYRIHLEAVISKLLLARAKSLLSLTDLVVEAAHRISVIHRRPLTTSMSSGVTGHRRALSSPAANWVGDVIGLGLSL